MDIEILRKLDEALIIGSEGKPINMVDLSIEDRSYYIAKDIIIGDIDLALKRIAYFIFSDNKYSPGQYIHRLILNRQSDISARLEVMIGPCLYVLPMVDIEKLSHNDYNKVYTHYLNRVNSELSDSECKVFKDIIGYYDNNIDKLSVLSYLY